VSKKRNKRRIKVNNDNKLWRERGCKCRQNRKKAGWIYRLGRICEARQLWLMVALGSLKISKRKKLAARG